uniref:Putative serine proteinase inhibitor n=1 Tax=Pacifastacus leniusculus TaxID=6720 RepID=Q26058_PACLE|nr:putative serine proteinase inhibitor [Pacifastacus leniusculus]prf//2202195A serpin [Pacifastacus leniusculus]
MKLAVVLLVGLAGVVPPQCISHNDTLALPSSPDLAHITPFGVDLFKELNPTGTTSNFFFSPYSIWNSLVLAYFGSSGGTRQQLQKVLRLGDPAHTLATYRALSHLYAERQANTSDYVIDLANRVYVDEKFPLRECVKGVLFQEVQAIDFGQAEEAAARINQLVNETTRGKIPELVTARDVSGVPMVLVNAAYFKGLWSNAFEASETVPEKFFSSPDQHTFVPMMKLISAFKIGESEELGATVLEMPYKGKAASMFVLLPYTTVTTTRVDDTTANNTTTACNATTGKATTPLDAMLLRLTSDTLRTGLASREKQEVELQLPKFKLEQTIINELVDALQRQGIKDLFTSNADLTIYDPSGRLRVSKGIHKAVVEVNEEGSEAAAGTGLIVTFSLPPKPKKFVCNHPFVFLIQDNHTNNILFLGVYRKPQID